MTQGMQIMTATIVGFVCLALIVIVPIVVDNRIWENVATICVERGGTWEKAAILGQERAAWRCAIPAGGQAG